MDAEPAIAAPAPSRLTVLGARLSKLNDRYGPIFALGSGLATVVFFRRGASFAPAAVAGIVFAWIGAAAAARWLADRDGESRLRKLARAAAGMIVTGMIQDALFFLVPVWAGSATLGSVNMIFPALLAAMALFSCFERVFRDRVVAHPIAWAVWIAAVLFATFVAVVPMVGQVPIRWSFALAGALAGVASALTMASVVPRALRRAVLGALPCAAGALAFAVAPLLPPVPIRTVSTKIGTQLEEREIVDPLDVVPAGTPKLKAWFAVNAPKGYKQALAFHWSKDGKPVGKPFETQITGGRESGFRVWGDLSAPGPGRWRVDLVAESGQLIGRKSFTVR